MHWKKIKKIGEGSYGEVYFAVAVNSPTTKFAVVKSSKLNNSSSLVKEAEFLKELRGNPYVIQCYGVDTSLEGDDRHQDLVYNVFLEYAPGGSLHDLLQRDSLGGEILMPEGIVAYYSHMLLRAISHIHRKDLVHCDIKPGNVLVFDSRLGSGFSYLKLADFGLARYATEKETKRFRGTPSYASPESIKRGLHGKPTDIWSLGCTVLEMIKGGGSIWNDGCYGGFIHEGPPEIPQYVSEEGRDFLRRCFEINPDRRWTADMLLNHFFIKRHTRAMFSAPGFERSNLIRRENPFDSDWFCNEGMFSSKKPADDHHQECSPTNYQLFPEEKRVGIV